MMGTLTSLHNQRLQSLNPSKTCPSSLLDLESNSPTMKTDQGFPRKNGRVSKRVRAQKRSQTHLSPHTGCLDKHHQQHATAIPSKRQRTMLGKGVHLKTIPSLTTHMVMRNGKRKNGRFEMVMPRRKATHPHQQSQRHLRRKMLMKTMERSQPRLTRLPLQKKRWQE